MSIEDRFEISPPIHVGQIATAYPAIDKSSSRKVLLKIIHPQFASDKELVQRFEREGQAMSQVDHPNVVKVYEQGSEENLSYLVLEWVEGGNLLDKIKDGPLEQKRVKELATDILSGLDAVHKNGLIHRDLKPDNILICHNGSAKLGDFSLSGFANPSGLTEHDAMIGTPAYFAPELTDGSPATVASDLYSVGMILFESLTGSNPFLDVDPIIALGMIHKTELPSLKGKTTIDITLAELVDSLLSRLPKDRPASAAEALLQFTGVKPTSPEGKSIGLGVAVWMVFISIISIMIFGLNYYFKENISWEPPIPSHINFDWVSPPVLVDTVMLADTVIAETNSITTETHISLEPESSVEVEKIKPSLPAYLTIIVTPWARVFQNDEEIGITPLGTRVFKEGVHHFRFVNSSFPQVERTIMAKSGDNDTLRIDLMAESSRLEIAAEPWGYLWVDEDSIGLLPRKDPIWLKAGEHSLKILHPTFGEWKDTLIVAKGSSYNYRVDLLKQSLETDLNAE